MVCDICYSRLKDLTLNIDLPREKPNGANSIKIDMQEKLIELHQLLRTAREENLPRKATIQNHKINFLMIEILNVFGLPSHQGYEEILMKLGDVIDLNGEMVDQTLIELADAGLDYQTLSKLTEI